MAKQKDDAICINNQDSVEYLVVKNQASFIC